MTCKQFLFGSLNSLDEDLQKRITSTLHRLYDSSATAQEISKLCEDIVIDIENQNGIDTFTGHGVSIKFALLINKKENKDAAISFLERKLERLGRDEFHTLITMSAIYDKNGEYSEAIRTMERAKKIISIEDKLKYSVLMLKLAAKYWNYEAECTKAYEFQRKGVDLLDELRADYLELRTPSSEMGMLFLDAYKTAGYVYRIQNDHDKSSECYKKAYDIVKKCPSSKFYHLKGLSHVCSSQSKIKMFNRREISVSHLLDEAMEIGEELAANEEFMKAHVDSIVHIYSTLAHTTDVLKDRERGLKMRLTSLEWLKQYQGQDHPEVARTSAGVAFTYYLIKDRDKCDDYVDLAEDTLTSCKYEEDITKVKIYFREISDTLHILGNMFAMMCEFGNGEEYYKRSLDLHIKVYGVNHQRMSKIYRYLGNLYSRWGKKDLAIEWLTKAMDVSELYLPASQKIIDNIKLDMEKAITPRNQTPSYRGRNPKEFNLKGSYLKKF